jgi:hypothetical protein
MQSAPNESVRSVLSSVSWDSVERGIDEEGYATVPGILSASRCRELVGAFDDDALFRSRVNMESHAYGRGDYAYFAAPLPPLVESLRRHLYVPLASIANRMNQRMRVEVSYPGELSAFSKACREAGQARPTPLLLKYETSGFNRLHRDLYGEVFFPLQAAFLLSEPGDDFDGGEFLLVENAPRRQARGEAVSLSRGEMIVFPTRERPVAGRRGYYRAEMRHGVSRIRAGSRFALGIIFHDAA